MNPRYLIGSGYYSADPRSETFVKTWSENVIAATRQRPPETTVILSVGNSWTEVQTYATQNIRNLDVIASRANLGHVHQLIGKQEPAKANDYCGWSASILALALIVYNAGCDILFWEQDALCFGDVVGEMYRQLGDGKMIFGSYKQGGCHVMACEQSLFLIRHDWIPTFVAKYLALPNDRDIRSLPEDKFRRIELANLKAVRRFDFGPGRGRPLPYDAPVWSAQKFTADELAELKRRGMI